MESEARLRLSSQEVIRSGRPRPDWPGLHSILDELAEGIFLADPGGRILDANPALCHMLGLARQHCVRRRIADVVRVDEPGRIARCLAASRRGRPVDSEFRLRGDPDRRLRIRFMPQRGGAVAGLVRDLTDQRALEREIRLRVGYQEALDRVLAAALDPIPNDRFLDQALRAIGECVEVSRSYIFAVDDARRMMVCTHEWVAPGIEPFLGLEASYDDFLFWVKELRADRAIVADDIRRDLPEKVQEILSTQGILSLLVVPLRPGGRLCGFLGLDECLVRREWLPLEARLLRGLGNLLALAPRYPRQRPIA